MSQLTVHLAKELREVTVNKDLESKLKSAVQNAYSTDCEVRVSTLNFSQKIGHDSRPVDCLVSLCFEGLVTSDFIEIQIMAEAAVDAVAFYYGNAIDGKDVSVVIKSTIQQEIRVDLP